MSAPRLRPARTSDAAACAALVRALTPGADSQPLPTGLDRFLASIAAPRQATYIAEQRYCVAVDAQDRPIGLAALRAPRHLFHLFVAADWQGRGLGLRLFRAVTEADEHLPLTVNSSLAAVGFYTRLGFLPTQALQFNDGIHYLPMQRP
jgi:GNAT superfamily N-acetyltransferase